MAYDEGLAERIRTLVHDELDITEKKMFGGLAFLVNGNMSVAASGNGGMMARVDPEDSDALLAAPGVERMVMGGRSMNGWLRVDTAGLDDSAFTDWVDRCVDYARSLPPKRKCSLG